MWPIRSHTLTPLTGLTSIKNKFKWTQVKQYAFNKIKRIADYNNLLSYPDFNETFKIHSDASSYQLRALKRVRYLRVRYRAVSVGCIKLSGF